MRQCVKTVIDMHRSIKNSFQSHNVFHITQRMIKNLLWLSRNLFNMTAFLTFAFRSKRGQMNEKISPLKNIQFTAQYIALERRDSGSIDAHFSVYPS